MKYWTISFPGECDQHVTETWSEGQLLKSSYYKHWVFKMFEANKHALINNENFIEDWCAVHWAVETDQWGNKINNQYSDIVSDGGMDPRN
jgi:hypothetical protein